jgi:hypothetical protein
MFPATNPELCHRTATGEAFGELSHAIKAGIYQPDDKRTIESGKFLTTPALFRQGMLHGNWMQSSILHVG